MNKYLVILFFVLLLSACETYFVPEVNKVKDVITVEGLITDQPGENFVKITLGIGYNDSAHFNEVDRYNVRIESDKGDVFYLNEYYRGFYKADNSVRGEIGLSYRVVIESKDGEKVYQSDYDKLNACAAIDSINLVENKVDILRYSKAQGYYKESIPVLEIQSNSNIESFANFYRFEYNLLYQNVQTYPTKPFETRVYIIRPYSSKYSDYVSTVNGLEYANNKIIGNPFTYIAEETMDEKTIILGFDVDEKGRRLHAEKSISRYRMGFLIELMQYSLSEKGYNFWNGIENQKNASGQIFDPVISQLNGNMKCESNPDEIVFGYFGASAVSKYYRFGYLSTSGKVKNIPIKYFPTLTETKFYVGFPPDYWIDHYKYE